MCECACVRVHVWSASDGVLTGSLSNDYNISCLYIIYNILSIYNI